MPQKGKTNNPNGRTTGSKNKRTLEWLDLGTSITERHAKRFNAILNECDDETFMKCYCDILEYFKPKQARVTMAGDDKAPIHITISNKI